MALNLVENESNGRVILSVTRVAIPSRSISENPHTTNMARVEYLACLVALATAPFALCSNWSPMSSIFPWTALYSWTHCPESAVDASRTVALESESAALRYC